MPHRNQPTHSFVQIAHYLSGRYVEPRRAPPVPSAPTPPVTNDDYVNVTGDTMTGALILAADPVEALQAATKQYVDTREIDAGTY